MDRVRRGGWIQAIVLIGLVAGAGVVVTATFIVEGLASGHATFHASLSSVLLAVAGAILVAWPDAGLATRAPAAGLVLFAATQLVESLGAFGYASDNDTRVNAMVVLHDLGVGLAAVGLPAVVIGLGVGLGLAAWRRGGQRRIAGLVAVTGLIGGGLFVTARLIGL